MLKIRNLTVSIDEEIVLKNLNLQVPDGQKVVLFGPNGSGKTSLFKTIIGLSKYQIKEGEIIFYDQSINNLSVNQRHDLGIAMMFQQPPKVEGVKLGEFVSRAFDLNGNLDTQAAKLKVNDFTEKGLNNGLSGGEQKRSELFQLFVDKQAKFYLFDEPDSGVDLENMDLVGKIINQLLAERSGLLITHTGDILNYIQADLAYVMIDGTIECSGSPKSILNQIKEQGYSECFGCQKEGPNE
jgi:Fe-S cluster assembly ATP-binding protein